uniref:Uncharacterized protein n=1 Tax=Triticum urartu TaxID=4572 RepID=A0A8R7PAS9_TRIUA
MMTRQARSGRALVSRPQNLQILVFPTGVCPRAVVASDSLSRGARPPICTAMPPTWRPGLGQLPRCRVRR